MIILKRDFDIQMNITSYLEIPCDWFLPEASFGLRVLSLPASVCLCVCLSVCVSVNPEIVRAINHHAFKLEPPNLDKRCKITWLRSLLFLMAIDLDLQDQI